MAMSLHHHEENSTFIRLELNGPGYRKCRKNLTLLGTTAEKEKQRGPDYPGLLL
jgi:hypothetical protein